MMTLTLKWERDLINQQFNMFSQKTLLITGGTGSFGHAVLHRFLHTDHFKEIRIFSRDEKKQDDMRNQLKNEKLKFYIGVFFVKR